jgi:hypothetical protein
VFIGYNYSLWLIVSRIERLGYRVTLEPVAAA